MSNEIVQFLPEWKTSKIASKLDCMASLTSKAFNESCRHRPCRLMFLALPIWKHQPSHRAQSGQINCIETAIPGPEFLETNKLLAWSLESDTVVQAEFTFTMTAGKISYSLQLPSSSACRS